MSIHAIKNVSESDYDAHITAVYEKYSGYIISQFKKLLPDCENYDDLIQDIFLTVIMNRIRFDLNDELKTKSYFKIVCRRAALRYIRENNIKIEPMDNQPLNVSIDPEESLLSHEEVSHIINTIHSLDDDCRDVCYLSFVLSYSQYEIGKVLNLPPQKVASALFRGTRKLKKKLKKDFDD